MKQKYDIIGMSCSACSATIDKAVRKIDGVQEVNVNLLNNNMIVEYDEHKINDTFIMQTVENAGYKALLEKENIQKENKEDKMEDKKKSLILSFAFPCFKNSYFQKQRRLVFTV